jgi:hypothetical protein
MSGQGPRHPALAGNGTSSLSCLLWNLTLRLTGCQRLDYDMVLMAASVALVPHSRRLSIYSLCYSAVKGENAETQLGVCFLPLRARATSQEWETPHTAQIINHSGSWIRLRLTISSRPDSSVVFYRSLKTPQNPRPPSRSLRLSRVGFILQCQQHCYSPSRKRKTNLHYYYLV